MEYTTLGATGLEVSRLCLGCMSFGAPDRGNHIWTLPEDQSRPLIKQALELGINFVDTANVYSDGHSEEIAGRAVAALGLRLTESELRRLEEPYRPRAVAGTVVGR